MIKKEKLDIFLLTMKKQRFKIQMIYLILFTLIIGISIVMMFHYNTTYTYFAILFIDFVLYIIFRLLSYGLFKMFNKKILSNK
jgi:hypothetical protein